MKASSLTIEWCRTEEGNKHNDSHFIDRKSDNKSETLYMKMQK
jgi:hypothetical protein